MTEAASPMTWDILPAAEHRHPRVSTLLPDDPPHLAIMNARRNKDRPVDRAVS